MAQPVKIDNPFASNGTVTAGSASPYQFTFRGMNFAVEEVTPDIAAVWLADHNPHNRNLRATKSDTYAWDMLNGTWGFLGDPIRFDNHGNMIDGQHRAAAVVASETTQPMLVIRGFDTDAQDAMDSGAFRSNADVLRLKGLGNASLYAAVGRRVLILQHVMAGEPYRVPTKSELLAFVVGNAELGRAVDVALLSAAERILVAPSVIGTAFYLCAQRDAAAAETFYVEKLINSIGLAGDEPVRTLQKKIQRAGDDERRLPTDEIFRYIVLTWNHFRRGTTTLQKLQKPKNGWRPMTELEIL